MMKQAIAKSMKAKLAILFILLAIMAVSVFASSPTFQESIRYMARYTARISAVLFLIAIYQFVIKSAVNAGKLFQRLLLFAVNHFIHFGFLAANVIVNKIELVPIKLLGGVIAYLFILIFPFVVSKKEIKDRYYYLYFFYVGSVFLITYIARIRGDFEGAEPSWMQYAGFVAIAVALIAMPLVRLKKCKNSDA